MLNPKGDSGAYASRPIEERERALAYLDGTGRKERFNTAPIEDIKGTMLWVDVFSVCLEIYFMVADSVENQPPKTLNFEL